MGDNFGHIQPMKFFVEVFIDDKPETTYCTAFNLECLMAHLNIAVALNLARFPGYNIYEDESKKKLLASVNAAGFISNIKTLQKDPQGVNNPGGAGYRAVPVVTPTSPDFQKLVEEQRKEERHRGGADAPPPAAPPVPPPPSRDTTG